jgi:hypothetical protein
MPPKNVLAILTVAAVGLVLLTAPQRTADKAALEAKAA